MKIKMIKTLMLASWAVLLPVASLGWVSSRGIELPDDPLRGRKLFESKSCIQCHGLAERGPGIGPSLGQSHFQGTFLDLGASLWNHVPGMSVSFERSHVPWPQLNEQEAVELFTFLYFIDYLGRPGQPDRGRKVFQEGGCSSCHAVGGGRLGEAPDLQELRRFASPLYVGQEIWNHGPAMLESMRRLNIAPPAFKAGDLADLSAYIRRRAGPGPQRALLSAPGNPNRGAQLFKETGCARCHGPDARGGAGPDLRGISGRSSEAIAAAMWNHALAMRDAMWARGTQWPRFQGSDLADLTAFLYFLPFGDPPGDPRRGAELFTLRGCADCHPSSGAVRGAASEQWAATAPDLGENAAFESPAALVAALWSHSPLMKEAILGRGRPWPELTGSDLRDLRAYFTESGQREDAPRQ